MKSFLSTVVFTTTLFLFTGCEKDKLTVNEEKRYIQENYTPSSYDAGYQLTLKPGGIADILPGGDIMWSATYKIKGSSLTVKTKGGSYKETTFNFTIISEDRLKTKSGTVLVLKK